MMLRRLASRRTTAVVVSFSRQQISHQRALEFTRNLSLWPRRFRRDPLPRDLPVYFPSLETSIRARLVQSRGRVLRTALALVIVFACFELYKELVLVPLLSWADEEYESLSDKEKVELDHMADEDPVIFLPCPFTERAVEQPPYRPSDPEWPLLMKARDPKLQQQLSQELCRLIVRYCTSHPQFATFFGNDKNLQIRRVWLDFAIPTRPPPKHYIRGIVIDDEGIFWGERFIEDQASKTLNRAIYPKGMVMAFSDFFYAVYIIMRDDFKSYFGIESKPQRPPMAPGPVIMSIPGQHGRATTISQTPRPTGKPLVFPEGQDNLTNRFRLAFTYAATRFLRKNQSRQPLRRGCFELDGVAKVENDTKAATVSVHAWYDPQTRKFVDAWIVPKRWGTKASST